MKALFGNRWGKIGILLVAVCWTPLLLVILLAAIGLWPDPDPNPVGPGLLFGLSFWPAVICLAVGYFQVKRDHN